MTEEKKELTPVDQIGNITVFEEKKDDKVEDPMESSDIIQTEQVQVPEPPEFVFDGTNCRREIGKFRSILIQCENKFNLWWAEFQRKAFWILLLLLIGILAGERINSKIYEYRTDDQIKLGGFIHKDKIYDIKERIK